MIHVKINVSSDIEVEDCDVDDLIALAFSEARLLDLRAYRSNMRGNQTRFNDVIGKNVRFLCEMNSEGLVRLPAAAFGLHGNVFARSAIDEFIAHAPLAKSLITALATHGFHDRINSGISERTKKTYDHMFLRVIAGFAMATTGAKSYEDLSSDDALCLLREWSVPELRSFRRKDLWGAQFHQAGRVLREIALALGSVYDDPRVRKFHRAHRRELDERALRASELFDNPPEHLKEWRFLYDEWQKTRALRHRSTRPAMMRLLAYLDTCPIKQVANPKVFITKKRDETFVDFIRKIRAEKSQAEHSSSTAAELSDIRDFSDFIEIHYDLYNSGKRAYPLVGGHELSLYRDGSAASGTINISGEASSNPLPLFLYSITQEILLEGEHGWPGRHPLCRFFLNGTWRYCPVMTSIHLLPFELPERFIQLLGMDSGEGDIERFNGFTMQWETNTAQNAGYWKRQLRSPSPRGFARKTRNPNITGFYFATNKTGKPFVVPWQNETAHKMLFQVAKWVEEWVPISEPVPARVYRKRESNVDEKVYARYPDIFPLFRLPAEGAQPYGVPPTPYIMRKFWWDLMLETQQRHNARVLPKQALTFVTVDARGNPTSCEYNPHGMRVAGLTLLLKAGVPLPTVSRLIAGHASILMTLRYYRDDPAVTSGVLDDARVHRYSASPGLSETLKRMSFEEALQRTIVGSDTVLHDAYKSDGSQFVERDVGMCPWLGVGEACKTGGPCTRRDIRRGKDFSVYEHVEGGPGNCLLCRHLITDPDYIQAIYSKIEGEIRKIVVLTRRYNELDRQIVPLEELLASSDETQENFQDITINIRKIRVEQNSIVEKQSVHCKTTVQAQVYIEQLRLLEQMQDGSETKSRMLVHHDNALSEWVPVSDFEHLTRLVENSEFYSSLHDPEAEVSFKALIDSYVAQAGYRPISLAPRTEDQKKQDYIRTSRAIMQDISRQELIALEEDSISIDDLGFGKIFKHLGFAKFSAIGSRVKGKLANTVAKSLPVK